MRVGAASGLALSLATGCDEGEGSSSPQPAGSPTAGYDVGAIASVYCMVQQTRPLFDSGKLRGGQLPAWAARTSRENGPAIVDFRHPDDLSAERRADQLDEWLAAKGITLDRLRQEKIKTTEGGRVGK